MKTLRAQVEELQKSGYSGVLARAKVAHDVVLSAIARSGFDAYGTIKGGVVMSALTGDIRRATMDMDIDFIHHPISEAGVRRFVSRLAKAMSPVTLAIFGAIANLRHEDYRGKRIYLLIKDESMVRGIKTKIDIGVHTHESIRQIHLAFDVVSGDGTAELQANSKEQIFAEKLLSLLRHGVVSNRPKDVFDLYYLSDKVSVRTLKTYVKELIYDNVRCRANNKEDILQTIDVIFNARPFVRRLNRAKVNWMQIDPGEALAGIVRFIKRL